VTQTVLLTLGRLPKALDIARAFQAAGWRVLVAEPFRRHLTGASNCVARSFTVTAPVESPQRYLVDLADIVRAEGVSLVVPVSEETMHAAFLRPHLPPDVPLFTMPPELVLELHDKHRFIDRARAAGLAVPETYRLGSAEAAALAARHPTVVKPIFSCSGHGVRFLQAGDALPDAAAMPPHIVQRFIAGRVHSNCAIAAAGRVVANVIYRGAIMSGTVAVAFERVPDHAGITAWIERFVAATHYTGFISFDFVEAATGEVFAIECNPRATSGLHFLNPQDLVTAIVSPGSLQAARFRPEPRLQQFYAALTETQGSITKPRKFIRNLRALCTTPDVTWRRDDPMPFLTMTFTTWKIISMSIAQGVPFGEVATLDIGWYPK
jgi:predicted ATP-grasp superfamily ATP-dependent carboligase